MLRRLVVALATTTLLAGCTAEQPTAAPTPKMPPTTVAPSEPTPSGPVEPAPPPEMEGKDAAAAEAFVKYYFALLTHAQKTGDTSTLGRVALKTCEACRGSLRAIENVHRSGSIEGGDYVVRKVIAQRQGALPGKNAGFTAQARVHNKRMVITKARDTTLNGTSPPSETTVDLLLVRDDRSWHVARWALK